jgi:hypothetical protein
MVKTPQALSGGTTAINSAPSTIEAPPLADDLLFGAQAIADELGIDVRKAFYGLARGHIPGTKCGATWTSTKSRLRRHFNGEAG